MRKRIAYYRHQTDDPREDYMIGCRILTQPFFMREKDWIPISASWSPHIQQGRTYSTAEGDGRHLWDLLMERVSEQPKAPIAVPRYGEPLDAAHIRPYAEGGAHELANGLLLRTDIHRLLDLGYVTISRDGRFEVGRRLNEHFENGRHYYAMHGQALSLPENSDQRPSREVIEWHQTQRFLG
jgi:putative restriction endonuclease